MRGTNYKRTNNSENSHFVRNLISRSLFVMKRNFSAVDTHKNDSKLIFVDILKSINMKARNRKSTAL